MRDNQTLVGARTWCGTQLKTYDDGFGQAWLYREASGLAGVVRARTWEDAYNCCLDEIMTRVPEDEIYEAYGLYIIPNIESFHGAPVTEWTVVDDIEDTRTPFANRETAERLLADKLAEERDLIEGYEYQPNATGTGIVSIDLNGQELQPLTADLRSELGITLQVTES